MPLFTMMSVSTHAAPCLFSRAVSSHPAAGLTRPAPIVRRRKQTLKDVVVPRGMPDKAIDAVSATTLPPLLPLDDNYEKARGITVGLTRMLSWAWRLIPSSDPLPPPHS